MKKLSILCLFFISMQLRAQNFISEQMHLAKEYGADQVWIVNVGDLKPMEFPISFFLDYAWNTKKWNEDNLRDYYTQWAGEQFDTSHANEIGEILRKYSQHASRRKPELLNANTYSLTAYIEAERVVKEWKELEQQADKVNASVPAEYKDAFFELVLHPVKAFANLQQMYLAVAYNHISAKDSILSANNYANYAKQLYNNDSLISMKYNQVANGKWNHMMDQTHIAYNYWQQPPVNKMPEMIYLSDGHLSDTTLNTTYRPQSAKSMIPKNSAGNIFYEKEGIVSIEASQWTKAINSANTKWKVIPDIGKDGSGITTFPVTASTEPGTASPHVEYDFYSYDLGMLDLQLYFSPTLNFHNNEGLQYAISIDNEQPQTFSLNKEDNKIRTWESWVAKNIITKTSAHHIIKPGKHTVKYWMISPAIVLQKLVLDFGGMKPCYLGPPETKN